MKQIRIVAALVGMGMAAYAQAGDWSGSHVGFTLGRSAYSSSWTDVDGYKNGASLEASSQHLQTSASLGYDYQVNTLVYGVEIDRTLSSQHADSNYYQGSVLRQDALRRLITLRLRVGLAYGSSLFYLTGGLGQARVVHNWDDGGTSGQSWSGVHNSRRGLVSGVGLENRVNSNLSLRAELLNFRSGVASSTNDSGYTMQVTDSVNTLRVGLSYAF